MHRLLQFTRDLFELAPAGSPAPSGPAGKTPKLKEKVPVAHSGTAQDAIEKIAGNAPAAFRHPHATREALLGGMVVAYAFRRSARRSIGFSVGPEGLAVSAPKWVPLHEIDQSVRDKSGWILKKLRQTRERHERLESARIDWKDGATFPFQGEPLRLVIEAHPPAGAARAVNGVSAELKSLAAGLPEGAWPAEVERALHLRLPLGATREQIRDAVQAWLMRQARQIFSERLAHFAPQLGVQWHKLSLSSASTRWGSASSNGSIRLNWRLLHFKPAVMDYVVVHELSHLRVMDHSPRFWDTVRTIVPNYAELRSQLKDEGIPRW
ncbi:SprT family zinc-dependent metalloprotease [Polaromonas sp.]|uniref:M48 family metallopeptidase n=1 Tax=Polaromonas sp. TaxID=1869339 RepID=UPI001D40EADE|nr:SprT family zinc-dependent metalloprotease [Polaromonas sp.]MBT9476961.1 M48 family metallopeptidase [Polaromonas sp.]